MHNKRIANKLVSRRQALKILTGVLGYLALSANAYADTQAVPKSYASATLLMPVNKMRIEDVSVLTVVQKLQEEFHIPVNFIQTPDDKLVTIDVVNGTAKDILAQIVRQNPAYHLNEVAGRVVLMPSDVRFEQMVEVPVTDQIPRAQAARSFFNALRNKSPKFQDMDFALFISGLGIHWHEDPVTLSRKAPVLTHFVELLASDQTLFFSLHRHGMQNTKVRYLFWFGNVGTSPLSQTPLD